MRALGVAALLGVAACISFDDVHCSDGHICPPDTKCDELYGGCLSEQQLAACSNSSDGDSCTVGTAQGSCRNKACYAWFCGDGIRNGGEGCEGSDFGGATCLDFHFHNPDGLICLPDCTIDHSHCTGGCGDHVKDATELCDDMDLGTDSSGQPITCRSLGFYDTPGLACSPYCTYDVSKCTGFCGDAITNGPEQCDAAPPAGESCIDFSFDAGRLGCTLCAPGYEGCTRFGWQRVVSPTTRQLRGIWGASSNSFFVVGQAGTIIEYDSGELRPFPSPTTQDLYAIWGASSSDVYAVGNGGTIVHYDGVSFTAITPPTTPQLLGVWGSSSNDVYGVGVNGANGAILHYGGTWTDITPAQPPSLLRAVWGSSSNDVFVVGKFTATANNVLHYDGTTWSTALAPPTTIGFFDLAAVWGTGPLDVFAAGQDSSGKAVVIHYNGASWSRIDPAPTLSGTYAAISGNSGTDMLAVGTALMHFDGSKASPLLLPPELQAGTIQFRAIWSSPDGDTWAVGDSGYVERWGGASWTSVTTGTTNRLRSVSSDGTSDAFAVGDAGQVVHYDGATWTPSTAGTNDLYSVWASATNFVVAVGGLSTAVIYQFNGSSWSSASTCGVLPSGLFGVWGTSNTNAIAVGGSGAVRTFNGTCWGAPATTPSTTATLLGVTGSSVTDVLTGGSTNTAFHFDGTNWSSLALGTPPVSYMQGLWASAPTNAFAVGDAIAHYDGTAWSRMSDVTQTMRGVSGTGPRNVFAVGDAGRLLHYDGVSWTPMRVPAPAGTSLRGVSATSRSLVLVGDGGFAQRLAFSVRPHEVNCRDGWDDDQDGMPDCADSDCAADPYCAAGGTCPFVKDLACGDTVMGSTAGRTPARDYYTCDASAETGPEAIYRFVPPTNGSANATLSGFAPADLDVVVVGAMGASDACDPDFACLGASASSGATETVQWNATAPRPYFVIVEGKNGAAGPFTLQVSCP